jgi:hypothetical protein
VRKTLQSSLSRKNDGPKEPLSLKIGTLGEVKYLFLAISVQSWFLRAVTV